MSRNATTCFVDRITWAGDAPFSFLSLLLVVVVVCVSGRVGEKGAEDAATVQNAHSAIFASECGWVGCCYCIYAFRYIGIYLFVLLVFVVMVIEKAGT